MKTTLSDLDRTIIDDVLQRNSVRQFNQAMNEFNLQSLYENYRNHLVATYFQGSTLHYAVGMRRLFNQFLTSHQEEAARRLLPEVRYLQRIIALRRREKRPYADEVARYNAIAHDFNALNVGLRPLIRQFKAIQKRKQLPRGCTR